MNGSPGHFCFETQSTRGDFNSIVQSFKIAATPLHTRTQVGANQELYKAVETLGNQLNTQKESMQKYEHKIRKRETELKEKIQESRKLKADAANANLQLEKIAKERDVLKKSVENFEAVDEEKSR